jgi:hypothetical protein
VLHPQNAAARATVGAPATSASPAAFCSSPSPVVQSRGSSNPNRPASHRTTASLYLSPSPRLLRFPHRRHWMGHEHRRHRIDSRPQRAICEIPNRETPQRAVRETPPARSGRAELPASGAGRVLHDEIHAARATPPRASFHDDRNLQPPPPQIGLSPSRPDQGLRRRQTELPIRLASGGAATAFPGPLLVALGPPSLLGVRRAAARSGRVVGAAGAGWRRWWRRAGGWRPSTTSSSSAHHPRARTTTAWLAVRSERRREHNCLVLARRERGHYWTTSSFTARESSLLLHISPFCRWATVTCCG